MNRNWLLPEYIEDVLPPFSWRLERARRDILDLLERVSALGFDFIKTENLCTFDGKPGYSLGQGQ